MSLDDFNLDFRGSWKKRRFSTRSRFVVHSHLISDGLCCDYELHWWNVRVWVSASDSLHPADRNNRWFSLRSDLNDRWRERMSNGDEAREKREKENSGVGVIFSRSRWTCGVRKSRKTGTQTRQGDAFAPSLCLPERLIWIDQNEEKKKKKSWRWATRRNTHRCNLDYRWNEFSSARDLRVRKEIVPLSKYVRWKTAVISRYNS